MLTFLTPPHELLDAASPDGHTGAVLAYFEPRYEADAAPDETQPYWRPRPGELDQRLSADPRDYPTTILTSKILKIIHETNLFQLNPRVLEIGGAEGLEAVRFALMGAQVDVCELTKNGVRKTEALAEKYGVSDKVRARRCPAQELQLEDGVYGLVLNRGVLDYVKTARNKREIIRRTQLATAPGGLHVFAAWSEDTQPVVPCHSEVEMYPDYQGAISLAEYRRPGWQILFSTFEEKPDHSHRECADQPHTHTHLKLIAQRLGSGALMDSGMSNLQAIIAA
ncbi:MAG TPA: methyltransferase domain-containing protein [Candidatus Saccharimonadales bacterium]|nr:methyltransferase domain-containing protein [Candidatus Saccharimonadales bacterium]